MASISLVSVNIERSKHLDTLVPFLKKHRPEVTTMLECMERDVPLLEEALGARCFFTPLCILVERKDEPHGILGQAIFSKYPLLSTASHHYAGEHDPIPLFKDDTMEEIEKVACTVSVVELEKDGSRIQVATTHMTKTENGEVTKRQLEKVSALISVLDRMQEFVLTGDFNAPRGRAAWDAIAAKYKDNIPEKYTTSIDPMHRAAPLPYVVDGVFTTPGYNATDVELHQGISDHMAVTATIAKL